MLDRKPIALLAALAATAVLASCGGNLEESQIERQVKEDGTNAPLGFPLLATKNTTRVSGDDPVKDAAAVARAVYPGFTPSQRPAAVTLVDKDAWQAATAAAVLMAPPVRAPLLFTDGGDVPEVTGDTLQALRPAGTALANRAQAFRVGGAPAPEKLRTLPVTGRGPFELAAAVDAFAFRLTGQRSGAVVVAPASDPRFAVPAAGWAAKSGDSVLFTQRDTVPAPTREAIERRDGPDIYVLGPSSVIADSVVRRLRRLGRVRRVAGDTPVENAIAFARYSDASFGWGIRDPGHGLVIVNERRPLDAIAAAPLSAAGKYGPTLMIDSRTVLPAPLRNFLQDVQPGYQADPVRGVYNHAWLIGDEKAISASVQGAIDELTEIVRVRVGRQTQ